jgi:multiple sugar transport system ATP-binding protein
MTMADTIVVLREGAIEQIGSPIDLYSHPRNRFVASFLGAPQMNLLTAAQVTNGGGACELILDEGRARIPMRAESAGDPALLGIRPEHLRLTETGALRARVESCEILGPETIVHGALESGERLAASLRGLKRVRVGEIVNFDLEPEHIHLFDRNGEAIVS